MQKLFNTKIKYISSWVKYIYIIHIILACNLFLNNSFILKISSAVVLTLGSVVLIYRLLNIKRMIKYPFIVLYILFIFSYLVSALIGLRYGWYNNAKIIIWMTLQFGVMYLFDIKNEREYIRKEFYNSIIIIIAITSVLNLINVLMLLANYFTYYEPIKDTVYLVGVAPWGRLYGIYVDPNYSCVLSVIAFMSAIFLINKSKEIKWKFFLGISLVLQALYIACCASRTGLVAMCCCVVTFSFLIFLIKNENIYRAFVISLIFLVVTIASDKLIVEGYNLYTTTPVAKRISEFIYGFEKNDKMTKIGRDKELEGDISNRRFDLWKNAYEISKTSPIIGITFGNIVPYAKENLPNSYLLINGYAIFDAFHNIFVDLLVSQGIVGCVIFLVIIVMSLKYLIQNIRYIDEDKIEICIFLFSVCVGILCASFFVSEVLYVNNQVTVLFWTFWGYLIYFVNNRLERKEISDCLGEQKLNT